ncbi:MAG TPA: helix-turn-helix domain-containing protein, partial [Baekduia sp.]|nr:helix-turn-helix domain-containing protein [Baekduia sp.]
MPPSGTHDTDVGPDLAGLDAITGAVSDGAGVPEVVRAAARVLGSSLVLTDRSGTVLAEAARSPADVKSLLADGKDVEAIELRVADEPVGILRMRAAVDRSETLLRLVTTLIASEVERVRAPDRASEQAVDQFVHVLFGPKPPSDTAIRAEAAELGLDLEAGAVVVVARAHARVPVEDGWRDRVRAVAERGARAAISGTVAALPQRTDAAGAEIVLIVPGDDDAAIRACEAVLREFQASLSGHTFTLGRSRVAPAPGDLPRAGKEALLAANVAEGDDSQAPLAFDDTGAYRLLLPAMSEDPAELQRFYAETIEPLVAYDEQYETELVLTVETFLECDGNVAATAQRLFTHRHTIRYRLERVRELSGLDVGSTDGREKLSLGLKAMRVLGIVHRRGPASEEGVSAGRVP